MTIAFSSPISLEPIALEARFDITLSHHSVLALVFVLSALLNLKLYGWLHVGTIIRQWWIVYSWDILKKSFSEGDHFRRACLFRTVPVAHAHAFIIDFPYNGALMLPN